MDRRHAGGRRGYRRASRPGAARCRAAGCEGRTASSTRCARSSPKVMIAKPATRVAIAGDERHGFRMARSSRCDALPAIAPTRGRSRSGRATSSRASARRRRPANSQPDVLARPCRDSATIAADGCAPRAVDSAISLAARSDRARSRRLSIRTRGRCTRRHDPGQELAERGPTTGGAATSAARSRCRWPRRRQRDGQRRSLARRCRGTVRRSRPRWKAATSSPT